MSEKEKDTLEESLMEASYKKNVSPIDKATLEWDKDLIFVGRTQRRYEIEFDANLQWGCKPTDSLMLSLAGCLAIDMVMFLQKMKVKLASYRIDITGERNPTPPQYYKSFEMVVHIAGKNLNPQKVERAISLSQEKYCSVYHSLRKDLVVKISYVLEEKEPVKKSEN